MKYNYNLMQIQNILMQEDEKILKYSMVVACFLILLVSSLIILRIDKLKLVFSFIIAFLKESRK